MRFQLLFYLTEVNEVVLSINFQSTFVLNLGRWQKYEVKKLIRFNTTVRQVTFDEETEKFTVVAEQV
jgi:hypothetical protein